MTLLLLVTCGILATCYIPSVVVGQQNPYFFNYQQPQIQTGSYQPFSNSPLGSYYQPNVNSPPPGQGSPSDPYQNFYSTQPQSQETGTITYPTEVISPTVASSALNSDNSNSLFQNFGNGLHQHQQPQQHPTASSPSVSNGFRPSIPFFNHHTHIVNGLPRQQFFGNNYEFFRQRHHVNTFPDPLYQGHLNGPSTATPATVKVQSSTPLYVGGSSTASSVKSLGQAKETKPSYIAQSRPSSPPSTQAQNLLTNFPRVSTASTLSSVTPTAKPLASSSFVTPSSNSLSTGSPSPTFAYSQNFPDRNSKTLKPLFGEDEDIEDAFGNSNGNFGNSLSLTPRRSPLFSSGNDFSTFQKPSLTSGSERPTKVHTTTPIRIVFNYEQALEALQQEPGVRVIISQTEKPELTTSAYPSPSAYQSPVSSTPRTTPRPFRPSPLISSTIVPSSTPRYTYSPVNVPYSSTSNSEVDPDEDEVDEEDDRRTTAAKLESLALELEQGKFNYLNNNYNNNRGIASARPTYQTATSPLPPQNELQTFQRGGKKFVKVPSPDNIYRDPEPRVVVNDLANILVHTVPPGQGQTSFPDFGTPAPRTVAPPSRTTQHLSKYSFPKFKSAKETLPDPSLRDEIDNLNQELTRQRFTSPSSTTPLPRSRSTPPPAFPSPTSAFRARPVQTTQQPLILSVTTYRPPVDFSPKGFEDLDDSSEEKETEVEVAPHPRTRPPPPPATTRRPPTVTRITSESPMFQTPRYYYNNRERGGVVRVVPQEESQKNRYGFNDLDDQNENPPQKRKNVKVLRRQRPRPRVPSPSPETVQVPTTSIPLVEEGFPQQLHLGPVISPVPVVPAAPPVPPVANGPQVLRVGPRGRLLRRKIRPRPQPGAGPQEITGEPSFVSSTPFGIATSEPFVTTFRPVTSNALIDQNAKDDDGVVVNGPFRSRFRFQPQQQQVQDDDSDSESDEAPARLPQRRRPNFSTTTTTESSVSAPVVASDRANILQRQIRFNRNRKNQRNNNNNN